MATLDRSDFDSATWQRLRLLLAARVQNYLGDLLIVRDEATTNITRGRIRELKDLLALEPAKATAPGDDGATLIDPELQDSDD